jgi:YVTN family beta-propeller protein
MKSRLFNFVFVMLAGLSACNFFDNGDPSTGKEHSYLQNEGVFLINEGNFMSGNGSVSFYSFKSSSVYNDLFSEINGRPLGDIPNSITVNGDVALIVVNNSGKIEVTESTTLKSLKTITGLDSPRNLLVVDLNKAYVTSLWSEKITIIDLNNYSVSGYINIWRSSEAMAIVQKKVYVSCWASGDEIMVIDPVISKVTDSIKVGIEPGSMVVDKNQKLWVLCSGGYSGQNYPKLMTINTMTDKVEKIYQFPSKTSSPTSLCINRTGDTLYYIEGGLRRMSISDPELPATNFVPASGRVFYKLTADSQSGGLFATNVMDYQEKGYLLRINRKGEVTDSARAGIIPGSICSNRNLN